MREHDVLDVYVPLKLGYIHGAEKEEALFSYRQSVSFSSLAQNRWSHRTSMYNDFIFNIIIITIHYLTSCELRVLIIS